MSIKWIKQTNKRKYNLPVWECVCVCGTKLELTSRSKKKKSCGCLPRVSKPHRDLTGKKFGFTTVLKYDKGKWLCRCDCGKLHKVSTGNLNGGMVTSCNCGVARSRKGLSRTPEYNAWKSMIHRCHNKKHQAYPRYGALGIKVCKRWRKSFKNFLTDMGNRPLSYLSLDRIDNNCGYSKKNCVWTSVLIQGNNQHQRSEVNLVKALIYEYRINRISKQTVKKYFKVRPNLLKIYRKIKFKI